MSSQKTQFRLLAFLVVLSFFGSLAQAAEPVASPSPESVVGSYLEAMKAGQYLESAKLMHPEALEKFRTVLLPLAEAEQESGEANPADSLLALFRGVPDVAALKKLPPAEFFAAFFGGVTDANPMLKEALASGSMTAIGSVPEGDTIHVVCRTSAAVEGISISKMEVVSLKRSAGEWRVLLSGEIEGMAQALRKALSEKT